VNLPPGPRRGLLGHRARTLLAVLALLVLLAPVVYLFARTWGATGGAATDTAAERTAVAYARPATTLLAALVDVQYNAARGAGTDAAGVRAAVDEVNAVDRASGDPLQIRQRWTEVAHEVDRALNGNPTGQDALRVYAVPIALTQALLGRIADSSRITRDPAPGSYQLSQVALRGLPDVIVNAGQVSALAAQSRATDARLLVAQDRLTRASSAVGTGLRAGTEPGADYVVGLNLLGPLDEFSAAADALNQAVAGLDAPGGRERVDGANALMKTKALGLSTAVLTAFDSQLSTHAGDIAGERRLLVLVALIGLLAAAGLLWLRVYPRSAPAPQPSEEDSRARHGYTPEEAGPEGPPRIPDLVDARELLPRQLAPAGLGPQHNRQERDDRR
jgi:hypothetical protein